MIGQRLRAARQAQSLSLSDLSGRTGSLSKSRISNYEQGIRRMGLEEAQELAQALGTVTPVYLLCLDDTDPLSQEERSLVERYRLADARGRETILRVAETQAVYRKGEGGAGEGGNGEGGAGEGPNGEYEDPQEGTAEDGTGEPPTEAPREHSESRGTDAPQTREGL